jgi:hypothetical protein
MTYTAELVLAAIQTSRLAKQAHIVYPYTLLDNGSSSRVAENQVSPGSTGPALLFRPSLHAILLPPISWD